MKLLNEEHRHKVILDGGEHIAARMRDSGFTHVTQTTNTIYYGEWKIPGRIWKEAKEVFCGTMKAIVMNGKCFKRDFPDPTSRAKFASVLEHDFLSKEYRLYHQMQVSFKE